MKTKLLFITIFVVSLFCVVFLSISLGTEAATPVTPQKPFTDNLPEVSGTYIVREHPGLKLRVFVHTPGGNRAKPAPAPEPKYVCTLEGPDSSEVDGLTGWYLPSSEFTYRLNTASVPSLVGSGNLGTIAYNSFTAWTSEIEGKVKLSRGSDTTKSKARFDGENIIAWGRASSGTLGVTYIWYYSNGLVAEVDTIMNKKYTWTWSDPEDWPIEDVCAYSYSYDAQNILTHELGHWMGIDDEYDDLYRENTMYGFGAMQETKKDTLTTGDVEAITGLYLQ